MGKGPMQQARYPILERIGKVLHEQLSDVAHEPLPERWMNVIKYLNDKERRQREIARRAESRPHKLKRRNA